MRFGLQLTLSWGKTLCTWHQTRIAFLGLLFFIFIYLLSLFVCGVGKAWLPKDYNGEQFLPLHIHCLAKKVALHYALPLLTLIHPSGLEQGQCKPIKPCDQHIQTYQQFHCFWCMIQPDYLTLLKWRLLFLVGSITCNDICKQ